MEEGEVVVAAAMNRKWAVLGYHHRRRRHLERRKV
jgi:hypothetical protein